MSPLSKCGMVFSCRYINKKARNGIVVLILVGLGVLIFKQQNNACNNENYQNHTHNAPGSSPEQIIAFLPVGLNHTVGKWVTMWQPSVMEEVKQLSNSNVTMTDKRVIQCIKKMMLPPSIHPMVKFSRKALVTPQVEVVLKLTKSKKNGVFIEAGALDGERSSNTLQLETIYNWSGLLVEADPFFFLQVMGRNRNASTINACLSLTTKPNMMYYIESNQGTGRVAQGHTTSLQVPCFPIFSLMTALNMTKVDYFSLDVEGAELDILKTIPFDEVDISILSVEYGHGDKFKLKEFMESKGYSTYKDIRFLDLPQQLQVDDFMFVKKSFMKNV